MAWCHHATSHYLSWCWRKSMSAWGIARPQCVKARNQRPAIIEYQISCILSDYFSHIAYHTHTAALSKSCVLLCAFRTDPVRPFISGHVANSLAAEVIGLLHSLLSAPETLAAHTWATAVEKVSGEDSQKGPMWDVCLCISFYVVFLMLIWNYHEHWPILLIPWKVKFDGSSLCCNSIPASSHHCKFLQNFVLITLSKFDLRGKRNQSRTIHRRLMWYCVICRWSLKPCPVYPCWWTQWRRSGRHAVRGRLSCPWPNRPTLPSPHWEALRKPSNLGVKCRWGIQWLKRTYSHYVFIGPGRLS